jgi:hypothetical protein
MAVASWRRNRRRCSQKVKRRSLARGGWATNGAIVSCLKVCSSSRPRGDACKAQNWDERQK